MREAIPPFRLLILGALTFMLTTSCTNRTGGHDARLKAVATTSMITDLVRTIGGEHINLTGLMGPGIDPHLYKAKEGDVLLLTEAAVVFYNGLHLEGKMGDLLEKMQARGTRTVAAATAVAPARLLTPQEFEGAHDPHIWFDVELWLPAVDLVRDTLVELDAPHADAYQKNAASYRRELEDLHRYVQERAQLVPAERRVLVTAHDAFNYFGRAYGFEVRGLQGISTSAEAGAADVRDLAAFIVERRIPAIFVETSVPSRTIEAVLAAAQARGFKVVKGGELFSDALGTPGTPAGTYAGMVRHNIDTIVGALEKE